MQNRCWEELLPGTVGIPKRKKGKGEKDGKEKSGAEAEFGAAEHTSCVPIPFERIQSGDALYFGTCFFWSYVGSTGSY